jgi:4-hydroxy-tetrahydrodipicolinate synthase
MLTSRYEGKSMPTRLPGGSLAAVLTPLTERGEVDEDSLRSEIDAIVTAGVSGIVVLGSTGEVAALAAHSREMVIRTAVEAVPEGYPVIVGVANANLSGALDDLALVEHSGGAAALVAPPFYGPIDQAGVARFYETLAAASETSILGYHIPAFTGIRLEPETVSALARDGVLIGLKDSNRDLEYFQQILAIGDEIETGWATYVGTDSLIFPAMMLGATGAITLAASVMPAWTAQLVRLIEIHDLDAAAELQAKLTKLILTLRRGSFPAGGKAALSLLGYGRPDLVAPMRGLDAVQIRALQADLERLGVFETPTMEIAK